MRSLYSAAFALCLLSTAYIHVHAQSGSADSPDIDLGGILDQLQDSVQTTTDDATGSLNDIITQTQGALGTTDLSQFMDLFQSAKCPVDSSAVFDPTLVANAKAACANPPATVSQSYCSTCYCAYYQLLMQAVDTTGSTVTASDTASDSIAKVLALSKCFSEASGVLESTLGADVGAALTDSCSTLESDPQAAYELYTQCLAAGPVVSGPALAPVVVSSPAVGVVSSPKPTTTNTTTTTTTAKPAATVNTTSQTSQTTSRPTGTAAPRNAAGVLGFSQCVMLLLAAAAVLAL